MGGGRKYRIGGMGKGSGMIHPNMATMLGAGAYARSLFGSKEALSVG